MKLAFWRREEERSISYQDVWGAGREWSSVQGGSIATAVTMAPVFAATRLVSDAIASLPLQAYRREDELRTPIATPPLFRDPTIFGSSYEWVQRCLISLLLRGNAYGLVSTVTAEGWPRQIEWLHPDEVTVRDNRAQARPQWLWRGRPVQPWLRRESVGELLHIPWYVLPGQIMGLSPIKAFATTIETGILADRFGRDWFSNGSIPSGVLETDSVVNEEQAKVIKQRFSVAASSREAVVLGLGTKYKPITVPPEESQFLETIKATATTVASIYGVPPEMIGGTSGSSLTYANVEQQSLNFVQHTLRPYLLKLEAHFSRVLPRPQYARFNLDALLRADLKTRYESYAIGLEKGFLTLDEVRGLEERPPLPPERDEEDDEPAISAGGGNGELIRLPAASGEAGR